MTSSTYCMIWLLTEDLNHGETIDGVFIENPFAGEYGVDGPEPEPEPESEPEIQTFSLDRSNRIFLKTDY